VQCPEFNPQYSKKGRREAGRDRASWEAEAGGSEIETSPEKFRENLPEKQNTKQKV
jgi:hypothetical protein